MQLIEVVGCFDVVTNSSFLRCWYTFLGGVFVIIEKNHIFARILYYSVRYACVGRALS